MRVVVTETIEHSADITAEMVEAYLKRRRWRRTMSDDGKTPGWIKGRRKAIASVGWRSAHVLGWAISLLATHEGRKPHEVLADIASGK